MRTIFMLAVALIVHTGCDKRNLMRDGVVEKKWHQLQKEGTSERFFTGKIWAERQTSQWHPEIYGLVLTGTTCGGDSVWHERVNIEADWWESISVGDTIHFTQCDKKL